MFPDEDGDCVCLMCGERIYDWLSAYTDRLLDAMEQQAFRDSLRERVRHHAMTASGPARRRWDALAGRQCDRQTEGRLQRLQQQRLQKDTSR
jgi:hypothetical protein